MNKKELQEALGKLGIEYPTTANVAELKDLYDASQNINNDEVQVIPGQKVAVFMLDEDGNQIEGEVALESLLNAEDETKSKMIAVLGSPDRDRESQTLFLKLLGIEIPDDAQEIATLVADHPVEFTEFLLGSLDDVVRISRNLEADLAKSNQDRTLEDFKALIPDINDELLKSFLVLKHVDLTDETARETLVEKTLEFPFIEFVSFIVAAHDHPIAILETVSSSDEEALPKVLEPEKTKDGLNIVFVKALIPHNKVRYRSGIELTAKRTRYELTDEQLTAFVEDSQLVVEDK